VGQHFEDLERMRLKEAGVQFFPGQLCVLADLALPVRGQPDFVVTGDEGYEVVEVKYRSSLPPSLPREWAYQAGVYALRYQRDGKPAPVRFALYNLEERQEMLMEEPPSDLVPMLREWTAALAEVLAGRIQPNDLPHSPVHCRRSEWACPDCIGARQAREELSEIESRTLSNFLTLHQAFQALSQDEKHYEAAKEAAKEICAAHGGQVYFQDRSLRLRESRFTGVDIKALPAEIRQQYPQEVVRRTLLVEKEE